MICCKNIVNIIFFLYIYHLNISFRTATLPNRVRLQTESNTKTRLCIAQDQVSLIYFLLHDILEKWFS